MKTETLHAIERVLDKRSKRGASDISLIQWLQLLKKIHIYNQSILDGFIDAIKQTPLNNKKRGAKKRKKVKLYRGNKWYQDLDNFYPSHTGTYDGHRD